MNDLIKRLQSIAEAELIRKADVLRMLDKEIWRCPNSYFNGLMVALRETASIPAVDAVEVVHGHWVTEQEAMEKDDYLLMDTCSVCGRCDWDCTESENFNYCPNCGARMDGRREEEHNAAD